MIGLGKDDRPFLNYLLFNARSVGYKDIVMVIQDKNFSIREYYGSKNKDNNFHGLKISYAFQPIPAYREKPLGTADAVMHAMLKRSDWKSKNFTVCNCDNLYSQKALRLMLESKKKNSMIDYDRSSLLFEDFQIQHFAVNFKDEKVFLTDIIEKPNDEELKRAGDNKGRIGVSMNIYRFNYDFTYSFFNNVSINPVRKEKEIADVLKMMMRSDPQSIFTYPLSEHVPDLTHK